MSLSYKVIAKLKQIKTGLNIIEVKTSLLWSFGQKTFQAFINVQDISKHVPVQIISKIFRYKIFVLCAHRPIKVTFALYIVFKKIIDMTSSSF